MSAVFFRPARRSARLAWLPLAFAAAAGAQDGPGVVIDGQVDETGHHYRWTVENRTASAIVYLEIPQYRGDVFLPPPGWSVVQADLSVVAASADSPQTAIGVRRSVEFRLRIRAAGAQRGTGSVRVRFADGSELIVAGVTVPTAPSDQYVGLIGLSLIFGIWILWRTVRRRRSADQASHTSPNGDFPPPPPDASP